MNVSDWSYRLNCSKTGDCHGPTYYIELKIIINCQSVCACADLRAVPSHLPRSQINITKVSGPGLHADSSLGCI